MQPFVLRGGDSCHVFDGTLLRARDYCIIYRVAVESFDGAELKVITESYSRMLTLSDKISAFDFVVGKHLYLQALGEGMVSGFFKLLSAQS